uniref:Uncharacterized protein n=1 Tax=Arundo donax TaxID=35708 RepID=A0A0A9F4Q8_ARUDO
MYFIRSTQASGPSKRSNMYSANKKASTEFKFKN